MAVGKSGQVLAQGGRVVEGFQDAVGVDGDVVPGGDFFAVGLLAGVPAGGDVGVWTEEDRQ